MLNYFRSKGTPIYSNADVIEPHHAPKTGCIHAIVSSDFSSERTDKTEVFRMSKPPDMLCTSVCLSVCQSVMD